MKKSIIVYGPPACGKTRNAKALAEKYGMSQVVDQQSWSSSYRPPELDTLILSNWSVEKLAMFGIQTIPFDEAIVGIESPVYRPAFKPTLMKGQSDFTDVREGFNRVLREKVNELRNNMVGMEQELLTRAINTPRARVALATGELRVAVHPGHKTYWIGELAILTIHNPILVDDGEGKYHFNCDYELL